MLSGRLSAARCRGCRHSCSESVMFLARCATSVTALSLLALPGSSSRSFVVVCVARRRLLLLCGRLCADVISMCAHRDVIISCCLLLLAVTCYTHALTGQSRHRYNTDNNSHLILTSSKLIWEEPRRKVAISYNGTPKIHQQTCPSLQQSPPPSNTPIPGSTPLTTPHGIQIK